MPNSVTSNEPTTSRHGLITAVVCLALAAVVAAMASLNVALPDIARATHASQTDLVWVIDAYSLAFAALLLPAGAIGDRFGRRFALLVGLLIFGLGSGVAMTAGSAGELIGLRAVLGVGAALVMPATLSTITGTFPASRRTRAVSIWAGVAGGAALMGLLASGALLAGFSWRSIFALNVALSALAFLGTLRFVPESADADAPRIDLGGALIAVLGLVALVFSVIGAPTRGWLAAPTLAGLALALVLLVVFIVWELRQAAPLLNPRIFRIRSLSAGSLTIFVQFFAFFGFAFAILQYLQLVRGDTPLLAAVQLLPTAATMIVVSRLTPRLAARYGPRPMLAVGLTLIAAGMAIIAQLGARGSYALMAAGLIVLGLGMGAAMTPATSAITEALPAAQQGVGLALNDLSREVGGALGIAVLGSILTAAYRNHLNLSGLPVHLAAQAKGSFAIATHLPAPIPGRAQIAFTTAMHISLLATAGVALLAGIGIALLLARNSAASQPEDTQTADDLRAAPMPAAWPARRSQPRHARRHRNLVSCLQLPGNRTTFSTIAKDVESLMGEPSRLEARLGPQAWRSSGHGPTGPNTVPAAASSAASLLDSPAQGALYRARNRTGR